MIYVHFQQHVWDWLKRCFGRSIATDPQERNHRFLEESLELVQACGYTRADAHKAVDYVFSREKGDIKQEVGGVMVCLSALCSVQCVAMVSCGWDELKRVSSQAMMDKIRKKNAAKPRYLRGDSADAGTDLSGVDGA